MVRHPRSHAFTLIELLVVISIIALLVSILLPALGSARETAVQLTCLSQQRSVGQAIHMYMADNGQHFPYYVWGAGTAADRGTPLDKALTYLGSSHTYYGSYDVKVTHCAKTYDEARIVGGANSNGFGQYGWNQNLMPYAESDGSPFLDYAGAHWSDYPGRPIKDALVQSPQTVAMLVDARRPAWYPVLTAPRWLIDTGSMFPHFGVYSEFISSLDREVAGPGNTVATFVDGHTSAHKKEDFDAAAALAFDQWRTKN